MAIPGRFGKSIWCTIVFVILAYVAITWSSSYYFVTPRAAQHYDYLTEGILHGHTYLSLEPDPRLATLANPYDGYQGVPRLHDATYFDGKYYLYFGVSPVLLLLAPWRLLTGTFLSDVAAIGVFSLAGTLFGIALWLGTARRYFSGLRNFWLNLGILTIAFGGFVTALIEGGVFYQIAITCAYACLMASFWFVSKAIAAESSGRKATWLGLASLAWGLAVGARPNYVFGLAALGVAGLVEFAAFGRRGGFRSWDTWRILFWSIVPAATVGLGLMTYNYVRFGSVAEFGQRYQFAAGDLRSEHLLGLGSMLPNLKDYFLNRCLYSRYFPFVEIPGATFGTLFWAPFAMLGLFFPALLAFRRWRSRTGLPLLGITLYVAVLAQITALLLFAFSHNRYLADFLPTLTLLGLLVTAAVFSTRIPGRFFRGGLAFLASGLAVFSMAHALLLTLQRCPHEKVVTPIARTLNLPVYFWDRLCGTPSGPLEGRVVFAEAGEGTREPLVATASGRDVLFLEHRAGGRIRFGFFHLGTISPYGAEIPIEYGREYRIRIDLGSLYPTSDYPSLWSYSRSATDALHRRVVVSLDGRVVYHASSDFYASDPRDVVLGRNPLGIFTVPDFGGRLSAMRQEGVPALKSLLAQEGSGAVRLHLIFPKFVAVYSEPLVSTGERAKGDLVFVTYLADGRVRFGHDSARFGAVETRAVDFDPAQEHTVEVDVPSLYPGGRSPAGNLFQLKFDGKLLIASERAFAETTPLDVAFGYNVMSSSASAPHFTGPKIESERIPSFGVPNRTDKGWGAVKLTLVFPEGITGVQEPLVVTGKTGAGDFVYVRYTSPYEIQVGYDHWAVGGFLSDPIRVDYRTTNQLEISFGGLFPPAGDPWWKENQAAEAARSTVRVKLNDKVIVNRSFAAHPAAQESIAVGRNPIGGSTCVSAFSGKIQVVENIGLPAELR
jgi:hypothetical protein